MPRPAPTAAGTALVALLVSSCATAPAEPSESDLAPASATPTTEVDDDQTSGDDSLAEGAVRPDRTLSSSSPADVPRIENFKPPSGKGDSVPVAIDETVLCDDAEALAANEDYEPTGWPADHTDGELLPDPECHPDFIQVVDWEPYFGDCWHPIAHGTIPTDETLERTGEPTLSEQERWEREWEASEIRSWWNPPAEGEPCLGHDGAPDGESATQEGDQPEAEGAYDHCYSCAVDGQHRG